MSKTFDEKTPQESREIRNIINAIVNACEASSVGEITPAQFEEMMTEAERQLATREREAVEKTNIDIVNGFTFKCGGNVYTAKVKVVKPDLTSQSLDGEVK